MPTTRSITSLSSDLTVPLQHVILTCHYLLSIHRQKALRWQRNCFFWTKSCSSTYRRKNIHGGTKKMLTINKRDGQLKCSKDYSSNSFLCHQVSFHDLEEISHAQIQKQLLYLCQWYSWGTMSVSYQARPEVLKSWLLLNFQATLWLSLQHIGQDIPRQRSKPHPTYSFKHP